mgnify:FL=1
MIKYFIEKLKALRQLFVSRSVVYASYEDATMTVKWSDGKTDKYTGSCTVWYKEPYMNRCSTSMEYLLCDLWQYHQKWKGAYPEAHKQHFG